MVAVPDLRTSLRTDDIRVGAPVRAQTGQDIAKLTNWLLSGGANVIPGYAPMTTLGASDEHIFYFRTKPRFQSLERKLFLRMHASNETTVDVEFQSGVTAETVVVPSSNEQATNFAFSEARASQSDSEEEITLAITPASDATSPILDYVSCWEVPRANLSTSNSDRGTSPFNIRPGQAVRRDDIDGAIQVLGDASLIGRRANLFAWAVPATVNGVTSTSFAEAVTSATYVDLFADGIPCLLRQLDRGATTATLTGGFYAWVTAGDANIRLNSSVNGAGTEADVSSATPAWVSSTVTVDAEDLSATDGLRSSAFDLVQVQAKKNSGGTLYIASAMGWEA